MKQHSRFISIVLGSFASLAITFSASVYANDRQQCLNDCTQTGATQHRQCQADHDAEMIRCGQLDTNKERNQCKRQANETLKNCNKTAREQVKQCQANCPPKTN